MHSISFKDDHCYCFVIVMLVEVFVIKKMKAKVCPVKKFKVKVINNVCLETKEYKRCVNKIIYDVIKSVCNCLLII